MSHRPAAGVSRPDCVQTTSRPAFGRLVAARLGFALCCVIASLAPAARADVSCAGIDIGAATLDAVLLRLGRDAGISVLFQREAVAGHAVEAQPALADCGALLEALLLDTGLEVREVSEAVYVVRPARPRTAALESGATTLPSDAKRVPPSGSSVVPSPVPDCAISVPTAAPSSTSSIASRSSVRVASPCPTSCVSCRPSRATRRAPTSRMGATARRA